MLTILDLVTLSKCLNLGLSSSSNKVDSCAANVFEASILTNVPCDGVICVLVSYAKV